MVTVTEEIKCKTNFWTPLAISFLKNGNENYISQNSRGQFVYLQEAVTKSRVKIVCYFEKW